MKEMKIAIISDTHDNLANLEKFLTLAKKEEVVGIIHCGDVTKVETLEFLLSNFSGWVKLACGNAEINRGDFKLLEQKRDNLELFSEVGEWQNLAFTHKPEKAEELAQTGKYNFVFYGHTHKPWIRDVAKGSPSGASQGEPLAPTLMANPGTLGGVFMTPTFAVLDLETGQLALRRL